MKYIGVKRPERGSPGSNIGTIWELKEDGKYHCTSHPKRGSLELWQIESDLNKGFIKQIE